MAREVAKIKNVSVETVLKQNQLNSIQIYKVFSKNSEKRKAEAEETKLFIRDIYIGRRELKRMFPNVKDIKIMTRKRSTNSVLEFANSEEATKALTVGYENYLDVQKYRRPAKKMKPNDDKKKEEKDENEKGDKQGEACEEDEKDGTGAEDKEDQEEKAEEDKGDEEEDEKDEEEDEKDEEEDEDEEDEEEDEEDEEEEEEDKEEEDEEEDEEDEEEENKEKEDEEEEAEEDKEDEIEEANKICCVIS